jgi:hypothetical protein
MSRVIGFEEKVSGRSLQIYPDRQWINPMADATPANPLGAFNFGWTRKDGGYRDIDAQTWFFTDYYSISPGMLSQTPGVGAKYMIAFTDSDGAPLSGDGNYRVTLPPNIPAANFWSVTLYEAENASGFANGQPSRRWARVTSPRRTPMAARTFTSAPRRRMARTATGSPPCRARDISPSLDSTAPPRRLSTKAGSREISRRSSPRRRNGGYPSENAGSYGYPEFPVLARSRRQTSVANGR